jgi:hypothetical protein
MPELKTIPRLSHKGKRHAPNSLGAALSGAATGSYSAPGHPFDPVTKTGILWSAESLELWQNGERLDVADIATGSPETCWNTGAFARAFPTITHWWFGSLWTQRVRATAVERRADGTSLVWLQAVQPDADELVWEVPVKGAPSGALPEFAGGPINQPLYLRLGHLARLAVDGQVPLNEWMLVSSLVTNNDLAGLLANGFWGEVS